MITVIDGLIAVIMAIIAFSSDFSAAETTKKPQVKSYVKHDFVIFQSSGHSLENDKAESETLSRLIARCAKDFLS